MTYVGIVSASHTVHRYIVQHIVLTVIAQYVVLTVVGRSEDDDCVGVEEIDSLQMELEILLASAAKRMRHIHNELTLLDLSLIHI